MRPRRPRAATFPLPAPPGPGGAELCHARFQGGASVVQFLLSADKLRPAVVQFLQRVGKLALGFFLFLAVFPPAVVQLPPRIGKRFIRLRAQRALPGGSQAVFQLSDAVCQALERFVVFRGIQLARQVTPKQDLVPYVGVECFRQNKYKAVKPSRAKRCVASLGADIAR